MEIRYKVTEIRYKMTWQDRKEAIHIGWPLMSLGWRFFQIGSRLVCLCGLLLMFCFTLWTKGYSATWPPRGPFPWHTLKDMSGLFAAALVGIVPGILMLRGNAAQVLRMTSQHFSIKTLFGVHRYAWTQVKELFVTDRSVYLCVGEPSAILVPKAALKNKEQTDAFAEQAEIYWRRATGRKHPTLITPNGVWPPAPSPANSQELDSRA